MNLRKTTISVNAYNRKVTNNTSGYIGVSFYSKKWHADIKINGIKKTKTCSSKDEAIRIR